MEPNWKSKTIWTGDCLDIMSGMNSETVDLIYLDPPFNFNFNYAAPIDCPTAAAAFKDTWSLSEVEAEWINLMEAKHPALYRVLLAAMTDSDKSYLAYMAARLLAMRRVLKPTGSIYLHCDSTMSHYLRLVMDAILWPKAFKSEIIWKRSSSYSDTRKDRPQYRPVHDTILYYTRSEDWTWNPIHTPYDQDYIDQFHRYTEAGTGRRYQLDDLTSPGGAANGSPQYDVMGVRRHWRYSEERMSELIAAGRVVQSRPGAVPRYKRFLDEMPGVPLQDIWADIPPIGPNAREYVGYPTQKPLALLKRIIEASSNPGDVVLDPFCGCATTCVAADILDRQWVGIDISPTSVKLVGRRLQQKPPLGIGAVFRHDYVTVRKTAPKRTDLSPLPNPRTHARTLYGQQEGHCAGCALHFELRHLEVDHIIARAKGGTDHIDNLQLLCGSCNRIKGDRGMDYLQVKLQLR